jgi:hypothetical protein
MPDLLKDIAPATPGPCSHTGLEPRARVLVLRGHSGTGSEGGPGWLGWVDRYLLF